MSPVSAKAFYDVFANWAEDHGGPENAKDYFMSMGIIDGAVAEELLRAFRKNVENVQEGGPVIKPRHEKTWYPGALDTDPCWSGFRKRLVEKGRSGQIPQLNDSSDTIVSLTPDPSKDPRTGRGLVVGFIQSGKTTNFTAVAAKLADRGYKMIIVLAGIHNALRAQTQERLIQDLTENDPTRWHKITDVDGDFDLIKASASNGSKGATGTKHDAAPYLTASGKTTLLVVKKNATVLRKLHTWLSKPAAKKALIDAKVLVIDDEADQASVATNTINPLIRDILALFPRGTYIGYTATPFANVFIDPSDEDDLYPRDFIYPLPQPEGYFGPETLFGRDVPDIDEDDVDGYDMIRIIPDEDEPKLRPIGKNGVKGFIPVMTDAIKKSFSWFVMATAARWVRGDRGDSSMLIHTSFKTEVHDAYQEPLEALRSDMEIRIRGNDSETVNRLRKQWEEETSKVCAGEWSRESEPFDDILRTLPDVLTDIRIIIDNSKSDERLQYFKDRSNTVLAIGGNTLSRGITLEGLVSSVFIRPTNTYDTLLQMGRWFGFRPGYEDLPRIWTTTELRDNFRHLSLVEHEMRQDMEAYELQEITPMEAAVKIRTHPQLRITAKMGAAQPKRISFSGARLQTRFFYRNDVEWLQGNWNASEHLVHSAMSKNSRQVLANGSILFKGVGVADIMEFLDNYQIHPKQSDMDLSLLRSYILDRNAQDIPELTRWNVVVMSGSGEKEHIADLVVKGLIRAPYKPAPELERVPARERGAKATADIKTLMSKQDLIVDIDGISVKEAKDMTEAQLKVCRIKNPETAKRGLLVLYPIDPESKPASDRSAAVREAMDSDGFPIGLALVFPKTSYSQSERDAVQATHLSVDLPDDSEDVSEDVDQDLYGSGE